MKRKIERNGNRIKQLKLKSKLLKVQNQKQREWLIKVRMKSKEQKRNIKEIMNYIDNIFKKNSIKNSGHLERKCYLKMNNYCQKKENKLVYVIRMDTINLNSM